MEQLTGTDSLILYTEQGNTFNHVAALGIYDPSSAPEGKVPFQDIPRHLGARLHVSPVFRRRLAMVPLGLDRPYWVEDAKIDLEFHVRHLALPKPGDWRQLMDQVARLHARPLDRSRPLWEVYVIEGLDRIADLPRGAFALFTKFHHASVDGMAAIHVVRELHTGTPQAADAARSSPTPRADRPPVAVDLYANTLGNVVERAAGLAQLSVTSARKIAGIVRDQVAERLVAGARDPDNATTLPSFARAPVTRFNQPISADRAVEAIGIPLEAMREIRARVDGATVNDIFLSVVGGALRRYLSEKSELPERSLVALMPISLRKDASAGGNDVGGVPVPVRSDLADPVERLRAVGREARKAKRQADVLGADLVKSLSETLPHLVSDQLLRRVLIPQLNVAASNVRGPDAPLFLAGARLARLYPVSMPVDYVGLNHTAISYDDVMWICIVACRNMLPDPAYYAGCLRGSFDELAKAATVLPMPGAASSPAKRKRASAKRDRP